MAEYEDFKSIPVGKLGIIPLPGCEMLASKIDYYLVKWRREWKNEHKESIQFDGYQRVSYILHASFPRFGTGEGKCVIK